MNCKACKCSIQSHLFGLVIGVYTVALHLSASFSLFIRWGRHGFLRFSFVLATKYDKLIGVENTFQFVFTLSRVSTESWIPGVEKGLSSKGEPPLTPPARVKACRAGSERGLMAGWGVGPRCAAARLLRPPSPGQLLCPSSVSPRACLFIGPFCPP